MTADLRYLAGSMGKRPLDVSLPSESSAPKRIPAQRTAMENLWPPFCAPYQIAPDKGPRFSHWRERRTPKIALGGSPEAIGC